MTPEEAESIIRHNWPPENRTMLREALGFVLAQAAQISDLKRQIITLSDSVVSVESRKDRQIEAMKGKLVEERAQVLAGKGNLIWEPLPDNDWPDGLYPALTIRGKEYWRAEAHRQLKTEMPEVEW